MKCTKCGGFEYDLDRVGRCPRCRAILYEVQQNSRGEPVFGIDAPEPIYPPFFKKEIQNDLQRKT